MMRRILWLVPALCLWPARLVQAGEITFDFDTGTPILVPGQVLPLDQTSVGITAHFSSVPGFGGYSIQDQNTTGFVLSQFSGSYVYPNSLTPGALDILFSGALSSVSFTFATNDTHQVEATTNILMNAYMDSTAGPLLGSATAHGTYGADSMPMGTLSFTSGVPFNFVEIMIAPGQPFGTPDMLLDNIAVTAAAVPSAPEPGTYILAGAALLSLVLLRRDARSRADAES